jgi:integrase/recombinase XerD
LGLPRAYLHYYVDVARPVLRARSGLPDEGWLWLGAEGERMTGKSISRRVRQLVTKHLGRPMSLHLFRDSAATTVAVHASAKIGIVRDVLGHSRHETNEKHYNQAKGIGAARRYQGLLKEQKERECRRKRWAPARARSSESAALVRQADGVKGGK